MTSLFFICSERGKKRKAKCETLITMISRQLLKLSKQKETSPSGFPPRCLCSLNFYKTLYSYVPQQDSHVKGGGEGAVFAWCSCWLSRTVPQPRLGSVLLSALVKSHQAPIVCHTLSFCVLQVLTISFAFWDLPDLASINIVPAPSPTPFFSPLLPRQTFQDMKTGQGNNDNKQTKTTDSAFTGP